jgi:hypothetical protein
MPIVEGRQVLMVHPEIPVDETNENIRVYYLLGPGPLPVVFIDEIENYYYVQFQPKNDTPLYYRRPLCQIM